MQVVLAIFMEGSVPKEMLYISSSQQRQDEEVAVFRELFIDGSFIMHFKETEVRHIINI
jgi:hypothetical protein